MVVWGPARGGRRGQVAAGVGGNGVARGCVTTFLLKENRDSLSAHSGNEKLSKT